MSQEARSDAQRRDWPVIDWRKWGFGFSLEFGDPAHLRLWIGPVRIGWKYGRNV